jgi:hypothetical protein
MNKRNLLETLSYANCLASNIIEFGSGKKSLFDRGLEDFFYMSFPLGNKLRKTNCYGQSLFFKTIFTNTFMNAFDKPLNDLNIKVVPTSDYHFYSRVKYQGEKYFFDPSYQGIYPMFSNGDFHIVHRRWNIDENIFPPKLIGDILMGQKTNFYNPCTLYKKRVLCVQDEVFFHVKSINPKETGGRYVSVIYLFLGDYVRYKNAVVQLGIPIAAKKVEMEKFFFTNINFEQPNLAGNKLGYFDNVTNYDKARSIFTHTLKNKNIVVEVFSKVYIENPENISLIKDIKEIYDNRK